MFKRFSKLSLLLVAALCFSVLLAACGDATATPGTNGPGQSVSVEKGVTSPLADAFPATTALYLTLNTDTGSGQIKSWQKIVDYLSAIPEVKQVFSNVDVLTLAKIGTYDADIKPWIGNDLAIGLTDLNLVLGLASSASGSSSGSGSSNALSSLSSGIPALVAASVKDRAGAEKFLNNLFTKLNLKATKQDLSNNTSLWTLDLGFLSLAAGLSSDKLFIGGGVDMVKAALNPAANTALSSSSQYKAVTKELPKGNLGFVYLDYQNVSKALASNPQAKPVLDGLKSGNLDYTGALGVTFATAPDGFRVDSYQTYLADKTPAAVAALLKKGPNKSAILSAVPENALFFLNSKDAASGYDSLVASLKSMNNLNTGSNSTKMDFDKSLADFEAKTGLNVKNDVVSLFSGEFAAYVVPAPANKEMPVSLGLITDATDKTATQAKLDKIASAIENNSDGKVKWQNKTTGSVTHRSATVQADKSSTTLNLGIVGNYAFLTLGDEATTALVNTSPTKNATTGAAAANFNKVKSYLPSDNSGYTYLDVQAAINLVNSNLPADQSQKVKNYTDRLTKLYSVGAASNQTTAGAYSTFFIYFPVTQ